MSVLGIFSVQSSNASACHEVQKSHPSMPLQLEPSYCLSKTAFKFWILLWWVCVVLKGLSREKGVCQWKVFALEVPVHYDCFLAHQFGHFVVAQNLIIFMIVIGLWTSNHFFLHNQSVTSSHGNVFQYIIFRKLLDCIFNSILLTFVWCQYSYQLTQLCLGCQGIMGYICYLSEILNIIHTHTGEYVNTLLLQITISFVCWFKSKAFVMNSGLLYSSCMRHVSESTSNI
jgi:hypothetical protein